MKNTSAAPSPTSPSVCWLSLAILVPSCETVTRSRQRSWVHSTSIEVPPLTSLLRPGTDASHALLGTLLHVVGTPQEYESAPPLKLRKVMAPSIGKERGLESLAEGVILYFSVVTVRILILSQFAKNKQTKNVLTNTPMDAFVHCSLHHGCYTYAFVGKSKNVTLFHPVYSKACVYDRQTRRKRWSIVRN